MTAFKALFQNNLSYKLVPLPLREIFYIETVPCDVYGISDGLFELLIEKNTEVEKELLVNLVGGGHKSIFVHQDEAELFVKLQQDNLRNISRSLSIGNPIEKSRQFLGLLSVNLAYLYKDPTNKELLELQHQCVLNFSKFLSENIKLQGQIFEEYLKQKHHYIYAQPLLSSLFLFGILKQTKLYSDKEIEALFVTSYFKDIGMSAIPEEKYEQDKLSEADKEIFKDHPLHSVELLSGKLGFSKDKLKIIENHHVFSLLANDGNLDDKETDLMMYGIETMLVTITDIIAAMITERPYRPATNLFDALHLVRQLISDQYSQEFKLLVTYFKNFFG
ncbi:MAG: HD-GYP domain-containing protein [Bacteriovoracaceae bacterium]